MENKEWQNDRPVDWFEIKLNPKVFPRLEGFEASKYNNAFEAGASSMKDAMIKWLFEMCYDHIEESVGKRITMQAHRYFCPQCMAWLREHSLKKSEVKE